jgi:hypothetical protein
MSYVIVNVQIQNFLCSLDAEKCIWHDGLFHKLHNVLLDIHWRCLRKWYGILDVVIKLNGNIHPDSYFKQITP